MAEAILNHWPEVAGEDFPATYDRFHRLVRSVLFKMGAGDQLDDQVQEVFLRVWQKRSQLRAAPSQKAWICAIALNVARDQWRRTRVTVPIKEGLADPAVSPTEGRELLMKGLMALAEEHRAVLVLHYLEGLTLEEVGSAVQAPEGTVKSRLHHAKKRLAEFLEREGGLP